MLEVVTWTKIKGLLGSLEDLKRKQIFFSLLADSRPSLSYVAFKAKGESRSRNGRQGKSGSREAGQGTNTATVQSARHGRQWFVTIAGVRLVWRACSGECGLNGRASECEVRRHERRGARTEGAYLQRSAYMKIQDRIRDCVYSGTGRRVLQVMPG